MEKWFVKNEGQPELKDWVESREDLDTNYLPVPNYGYIISDGYHDNSYQNWSHSDETEFLESKGYKEITFEEFLKKIKDLKVEEQMKYKELEQLVIQWGKDKGILDKATPLAQAGKTKEEVEELIEACQAQKEGKSYFYNSKGVYVNTEEEISDALGDVLVTIILGAKLQGLELIDCLQGAYDIISKRTGKMVDGVFVKDGQ